MKKLKADWTRTRSLLDRLALAAALAVVASTAFAQWGHADDSDPRIQVREVVAEETAQVPVCSGSVFRFCNPSGAHRDAAKQAEESAVLEAEHRCEVRHAGHVRRKIVFPARCVSYAGFDGGSVECTVKVKARCEVELRDSRISGNLNGRSFDPISEALPPVAPAADPALSEAAR
jgi:hypothetical protein